MKTKSLWGKAPSRIYAFIRKYGDYIADGCVGVVGCSDGKFVFPFLRAGIKVCGFEIDPTALHGGEKVAPVNSRAVKVRHDAKATEKVETVPCKSNTVHCDGLLCRVAQENLAGLFTLQEKDFFHTETAQLFSAVVTSCSIQYKCNRDLSLEQAVEKLQCIVEKDGYLLMDYMMPLDDRHEWKAPVFARTGQMRQLFDKGWTVISNIEKKTPVFEAAHVDRPEDHFHRFGYILAQKRDNP